MRYTGGLAGGSWVTALASDLGNGKFDGGMLVENFENLNPVQHALDQELQPLVEGGYRGAALHRVREMVGRPRQPQRRGDPVDRRPAVRRQPPGHRRDRHRAKGERIDLRNIRSPIICFCSKGDNITPPQQALGWIVDLYGSDDDIRACGQTIVYCGPRERRPPRHLRLGRRGQEGAPGVRLQHRPDRRAAARPVRGGDDRAIDRRRGNPEAIGGDWIVRFEPRTLDDIRAIVQPEPENERRFAAVRRVSEINLGLYRTLVQPFVRASINEQTRRVAEEAEPRRAAVRDLLGAQPADAAGGAARRAGARAAPAGRARQPAAAVAGAWSRTGSSPALDGYRDLRDRNLEKIFLAIYGSPVVQAMVGVGADGRAAAAAARAWTRSASR